MHDTGEKEEDNWLPDQGKKYRQGEKEEENWLPDQGKKYR